MSDPAERGGRPKSTSSGDVKIGCVIQGNIRAPIRPIIDELVPKFDVVVLSTWHEDKLRCPPGRYELVLNERPPEAGVTNRNLQRLTTAAGLRVLAKAGCTHVLKWRTDLLPTRLDVAALLRLSQLNPDNALGGRIVTGSFRHLSVVPDWFSSFPDLYSFSTLKAAQCLWSDEGFDYDRAFNMPERMRRELQIQSGQADSIIYREREYSLKGIYAYDAHTELYAIFKDRIQLMTGESLTHPQIIARYFALINDYRLGICWFNSAGKLPYRPLRQGYHLRWWREDPGFAPTVYSFEQLQTEAPQGLASRLFWSLPIRFEQLRQGTSYLRYRLDAAARRVN